MGSARWSVWWRSRSTKGSTQRARLRSLAVGMGVYLPTDTTAFVIVGARLCLGQLVRPLGDEAGRSRPLRTGWAC